MPSLDEVLRILAESGRVAHLTLVPSKSEWQASFREVGGSGYRVKIRKDPVDALLDALGPKFGETWEQHLETPAPIPAPKTKDVKRRAKKREESPYDEDVEDML